MNRYLKLLLLIVIFNSRFSIVNCQAPPPPPADAAAENKIVLSKIDSTLNVKWNKKVYCSNIISTELFIASSYKGSALLNNTTINNVESSLIAFDTLGVKGVSLTINYPILVKSFKHSSQYLAFYQNVVKDIRQKGYKLLISSNASWADTTINKLKADTFTQGMTSLRYKTEKAEMLQTIIDSLKPDYLTIENEPTTWLKSTGLNYSIDSVKSYVNYFLANINKKSTKIGSGAGTWENVNYINTYAKIAGIDYLDMHIGPVYFNYFIKDATSIDSIAKANKKPLIIGNSWLYKANDAEVTYDTINVYDKIVSRNAFSNYMTDDSLFIADVFKLSNILQTEFTSYNWSQYLFGYLIYEKGLSDSLKPFQVYNIANTLCINALNSRTLSVSGKLLKTLMKLKCVYGINSLKGTQNASAEIYPNPISDNLNIDLYLPRTENVLVKIIDLQGKVMLNVEKSNLMRGLNKLSIDTKHLDDGTYIVVLQNTSFTLTRRFIIIKN